MQNMTNKIAKLWLLPIFLVIGLINAAHAGSGKHCDQPPPAEQFADELGLAEDQRAEFVELVVSHHQQRCQLVQGFKGRPTEEQRAQMKENRRAFYDELTLLLDEEQLNQAKHIMRDKHHGKHHSKRTKHHDKKCKKEHACDEYHDDDDALEEPEE